MENLAITLVDQIYLYLQEDPILKVYSGPEAQKYINGTLNDVIDPTVHWALQEYEESSTQRKTAERFAKASRKTFVDIHAYNYLEKIQPPNGNTHFNLEDKASDAYHLMEIDNIQYACLELVIIINHPIAESLNYI